MQVNLLQDLLVCRRYRRCFLLHMPGSSAALWGGKCVIMISSEMPELMGMSDRIMVMCEGHKSGILDKSEVTDEKIMLLASTYETNGEDKK